MKTGGQYNNVGELGHCLMIPSVGYPWKPYHGLWLDIQISSNLWFCAEGIKPLELKLMSGSNLTKNLVG